MARNGARKGLATWVVGVLAATATPAVAEVIDAGPGGFTVSLSAAVKAAPEAAFGKLVDVASWWAPGHTWSGDAANLSLDPTPGGCFCERLPGGGVQHLEVVYAHPPKLLRLRGGLGPLQAMAVQGSLTWAVAAAEGGSRITVTYAVVGYAPDGLQGWAAAVDGMLGEQLGRLAAAADSDRALPAGP